jgi:hypothetical protein
MLCEEEIPYVCIFVYFCLRKPTLGQARPERTKIAYRILRQTLASPVTRYTYTSGAGKVGSFKISICLLSLQRYTFFYIENSL